MALFTGSGVAIVTPFNDDSSINFEVFKQLIEFQIENKTDAIIVCGTTGEPSTMSVDEHLEAVRFAVSTVNKRVPVIAGAGSNDTAHAVSLCRESQKLGADGVLLATPYYNKTTQKGLIAHYQRIAASIDIPMILYNVPARTGMNILPKTAYELTKTGNITAIKEASGNITQIAELANLIYGKMDIYSGNDDHIVPVLSLGGIGVISVLANVAPRDTHDMVISFLEGDTAKARDLQLKAIPLVSALFCEVSPIPVKRSLNMMGYNVGGCRMPLCEMEDHNADRLRQSMIDYGLKVI